MGSRKIDKKDVDVHNYYMSTQVLQKSKLIKKNIFMDSGIWSLATTFAKQNNTSVAEEIRSKLAQIYIENDLDFVQKRAEKRRQLAGSIISVQNSDINGAINHNDIYTK
jgi:predicted Zn-dependent peptidase